MDRETDEAFGVLVRRYRRDRGWTQAELAERARLSVEAISTLERSARRTPWPDTVSRLSDALGLDDGQLAALTSAGRARRRHDGVDPGPSPLPSTNLPHDLTSFIGREQAISEVTGLLLDRGVRLVTMTGPGGVGKTRLGIEVSRSVRARYPDGVFWVSLAPLTDPGLVPSSVAGVLGVKPKAGSDILEAITGFLRSRRLLLMLDNFEHLLDGASAVAALLSQCPEVDILVTSRAPLHLRGEHQYEVRQLALPNPTDEPDVTALCRSEAVALFTDRARAIKADFQLTESNAAAISEICASLDGLPLAIELAAARIKLFEPEALLRRLSSQMTVLTAGARDSPERHQTLRAAIDWSYSLLSRDERTLFARLAVFAGGCTMQAAEAVCAPLGKTELLDAIASLVDQSVLWRESDGEPHFRMLETVRQYAGEKLKAGGEADLIRHHHAEFFCGLARRGCSEWFSPTQPSWVSFFEVEQDEFRAALAWCLEKGEVELGLTLAIALSRHWYTNARYLREGQRWLERLLERSTQEENIMLRTRALHEASWLANRAGEPKRGESLASEALSLAQQVGASAMAAVILTTLAISVWNQGDVRRARERLEEALRFRDHVSDLAMPAIELHTLGAWAVYDGDYARAVPLLEEATSLWREFGDMRCLAFPLRFLGIAAIERGELESARALLREGLRPIGSSGDQLEIAGYLEEFAVLAVRERNFQRAVRLWGAAMSLIQISGIPLDWAAKGRHDQYEEVARGHVAEPCWAELAEEGEAMTFEEAIAYALEDPDFRLPDLSPASITHAARDSANVPVDQ